MGISSIFDTGVLLVKRCDRYSLHVDMVYSKEYKQTLNAHINELHSNFNPLSLVPPLSVDISLLLCKEYQPKNALTVLT